MRLHQALEIFLQCYHGCNEEKGGAGFTGDEKDNHKDSGGNNYNPNHEIHN